MQTYLVTTTNDKTTQEYIQKIKKDLKISDFDYEEIVPDPSLGIETVRNIQLKCKLKPMGTSNRLFVLKDFEKATPQAQQAMLKILEEPPAQTYIYLFCKNIFSLLPTIVSRAQHIQLQAKSDYGDLNKNIRELIYSMCRSSKGTRLLKVTDLFKTKEDALILLNTIQKTLEQLLFSDDTVLTKIQISTLLSKTAATIRFIEKNVHVKTTLDVYFLGYPYSIK
jgi:DNA polymerase III delta prime subunit